MGNLEGLLSQFRAAAVEKGMPAAVEKGTNWLHSQISELLVGVSQGASSDQASLATTRAQRSWPPERLSPAVTPQVQRHCRSTYRSNSRDPPGPAQKCRSAQPGVQPGRSPLPRRDPVGGLLQRLYSFPLPLLLLLGTSWWPLLYPGSGWPGVGA